MNIAILRKKINSLLGQTIIQFSPIRSGSTLVFNILKDVFPEKNIKKNHHCRPNDLKFPVVVTYRHPLDCIASSIMCHGLELNDEILENKMKEFNKNGFDDLVDLTCYQNVLMLKYEDFRYDFEVIFQGIEKYFNVNIPIELRKDLITKYSIEVVEEYVKDKKSFNEYDKTTLWHGNHISKYKGDCFYYKYFFNDQQVEYLTNIYKKFLIERGYM